MARELEVFARCTARCRESTQYSSSLPRGVNLGRLIVAVAFFFTPKCVLANSAIFMMADNKEQRMCVKFCFLLGKSAAETVLILQETFKEAAVRLKCTSGIDVSVPEMFSAAGKTLVQVFRVKRRVL